MKWIDRALNKYSEKLNFQRLRHEIWLEDPTRVLALFQEIDDALAIASTDFWSMDDLSAPAIAAMDDQGVLHVTVRGHLLREVPWIFRALGIQATSTAELETLFTQAMHDPTVKAVMLDVSSPGGTVSGVQAAATALRQLRGQKPVHAFVQDMAASAAYWIASQASTITAEPTAEIGSIGVYSVIEDSTRAFQKEGFDVHVIRSGKYKGEGVAGAPISPEFLQHMQKQVNMLADIFVEEVAMGRDQQTHNIKALATGETWLAAEAVEKGLIDFVGTQADVLADTISEIGLVAGPSPALKGDNMTEDNARIAALEAELKTLREEKAKIEAQSNAALAIIQTQRKCEIIETGVRDGRVTPALRASIDKYAENSTVEELSAFVAALPVAVRPAPIGDTPEQPEPSIAQNTFEQKFMTALGLTPALLHKYDDVNAMTADGRFIKNDKKG